MKDYKKKINLTCLILLILSIVVDQFTKILVQNKLIGNPIKIIDGVFSLTYLENRGVGFGFLQDRISLIIIVNILVLIAIAVYFIHLPKTSRFYILHILLTFIVSGAIGNIIDRVRLGYVIDFFYFELIDFPIFNIADIYVTVSVFLLMFLVLFVYKSEELDMIMLSDKKKNEVSDNE